MSASGEWGEWGDAIYDSESDCYGTTRSRMVEGRLKIEGVNLSPLETAHVKFHDRPDLHKVIFEAQENLPWMRTNIHGW